MENVPADGVSNSCQEKAASALGELAVRKLSAAGWSFLAVPSSGARKAVHFHIWGTMTGVDARQRRILLRRNLPVSPCRQANGNVQQGIVCCRHRTNTEPTASKSRLPAAARAV